MGFRALSAVSLVSLALSAQEPARVKASDYPAHIKLSNVELGARYLGHNVPARRGVYVLKDFLVVEMGVFPTLKDPVHIETFRFTLQVNGTKNPVAQPARYVATAAKYKNADWQAHSTAAPAQEVTFGGEPTHQRFPGADDDPSPMPRSSIALQPESSGDSTAVEPVNISVTNAALPEGPVSLPTKGCLYFRFDGNSEAIRSLELVYDSPSGGKTKLRLF